MTDVYNPRPRPNRKRKKQWFLPTLIFCLTLFLVWSLATDHLLPVLRVKKLENLAVPDWVDVQLIDVDGSSRRGEPLEAVRAIVIHYVGNPGTSAQNNRNYFASSESEVSSHFLVGLDGEVIQCVPLNEKSSASNHRNKDTISIEVCHPDESGKFTDAAYESLVRLTAWLKKECGLGQEDIIRHYDVTGKMCPLYFVEHGDAWDQFRRDAANYKER